MDEIESADRDRPPSSRRRDRLRGRRNLPCHTIAARGSSQRWAGSLREAGAKTGLRDREVFGLLAAPPNSGWRWTCCSRSRSASSRSRQGGHGNPALHCAQARKPCSNVHRQGGRVRPLYAVAARNSATCPQREREDGPVAQAVFDTLEGSPVRGAEEVLSRGHARVLPLTHSAALTTRLVRHRRRGQSQSATCC